MIDVFEVAKLLAAHAVKTHGDEVDLICYTGSYAHGEATAHSDLDIFYTPVEGKSPPIAYTFLVGGVLFDFWAIPWDRLERFATGQFGGWSVGPAVVHYAKVLHARSDVQVARLSKLKRLVDDLQKPEARPQMIRRALGEYRNVLFHLGNLRIAAGGDDFSDVRHAGWKLVWSVWECLALVNQAFLTSGRIVENIARLKAKPADLEQLIRTTAVSSDPAEIAKAAERLALDTRRILREFQRSLTSAQSVQDRFCQAYPEISAGLGKVHSAQNRNDPIGASAAAWFEQCDVSKMLADVAGESHSDFNLYSEFADRYREIGLPDLMRWGALDLPALANQTKLFDTRMRQWLREQSVGLSEFETVEELERSLESYTDPRQ